MKTFSDMIDLLETPEVVTIEIDGKRRCDRERITLFSGPESQLEARRHVTVVFEQRGRKGELSLGLGRRDRASYASASIMIDGSVESAKLTVPVPCAEDELTFDSPIQTLPLRPVFISHAVFYPVQCPTEEAEERLADERERRVGAELRFLAQLPEETFREFAMSAFQGIWYAVDDLEAVPRHLHPLDVIQKHLQRGNIDKDGDW